MKSIEERFWGKVSFGLGEDACWTWMAGKDKDEYGLFKTNDGMRGAHRISYGSYSCKAIPDNLQVLHHCDNPSCVNPNHLFLGTQADNMRDMVIKGRSNKPKNERNPQSKLTMGDATMIRYLHDDVNVSRKSLSIIYNVSLSTIDRVINNKSWEAKESKNGKI